MASTNKTLNYELSQFEGTDKPSWEADYNADMLAIDTNLKAVSDVANGASGDISTLDGRLTTAEGNISTNANDIDALEGRADALEAGQTSDDSRLDALEAEQIVQNTAIESNTRLGYNLARPYDSASTYAVGAYVLFQNTLYKCTTAVSTGEAFDPNKWLAIKATDEIAAGGYTLPTASASTLGGVKVGNGLRIDGNGVLSASGGETIILSSDDITFTNNTISGSVITNYYNPTTAGSSQSITSTVTGITLTNGAYTKIGKLRVLQLYLNIQYDNYSFNGKTYRTIELHSLLSSAIIDAPKYTIQANITKHSSAMTNITANLNTSKLLTIFENGYQGGNPSTTYGDNGGQFYITLIYVTD